MHASVDDDRFELTTRGVVDERGWKNDGGYTTSQPKISLANVIRGERDDDKGVEAERHGAETFTILEQRKIPTEVSSRQTREW